MKSGPVGQGPRRAVHHQGRHRARQLRPAAPYGRGHGGNAGIGLTVIANAMGFRSVESVIPETQTMEKKDALRLLGAGLVEVPAAPFKPDNYIHYAGRLAEALAASDQDGAVFANQFDNTANREGHIATTARDLGTDRGPHRRLRLGGRHRRHHRQRAWAEGLRAQRRGRPHRARRSRRAPRSTATTRPAS